MTREVKLHNDLKPFLHQRSALGWMVLQHPLVYSVPYTEDFNEHLNRIYEHKRKALDDSKDKKDYSHYVWLHERPYRLNAFQVIEQELSDESYWELLGRIWSDSENIWQYLPTWLLLLTSKRPGREAFMTEEGRRALADLPDTLTIYRGYQPGLNKEGLSYSLKKSKAKWFANRFGTKGRIRTRTVKKSEVFAILLGRQEDEIIVLTF